MATVSWNSLNIEAPCRGALAEMIPPDWLHLSDSSETLIMLILALVIMLLSGLLLHMLKLRMALQRETDALKQSEHHLRILSDARSDITIFQLVHDPGAGDFQFTFISSGLEEILGIHRDHLMQDASMALDLVSEEDLAVLKSILRHSLEGLKPTNQEIRVLGTGGEFKWVRISAIPQMKARKLVWDGFLMDVTDKKNFEQSVDEESRNFQNLFETIDDFLLVCNMDGELLHTNPALQKRLGYSENELGEMSVFELYSADAHPEVYRAVAALHSEPTALYKLPLRAKNGGRISVEMALFQGAWKHERAIFGVARDIDRYQQTENALRESQKMLQLIIDTIPMSVFWKDKDSVYLGCNRHFMEECRLDSIDDVVGRTPFDLFGPSEAPEIVDRDQGVMNTNRPLMGHQESHTLPDGSIGWREVSLIPLRDEAGKAVGVLGVWREVTDQIQAEERLKRTLEDMERFNQLMRGRERRTLELKDEINELLSELGKPRKYRTTAEEMP